MKYPSILCLLFAAHFFEKKLAQTDPVRLLPPFDSLQIEGEAMFFTEKYEVVLGGRHCNADPEIEACDFNADMLVIERGARRRVWAVPLFNFPLEVAEHFAAVGLCTAADEAGMAWVSGGYGYDGTVGTFSTLGQLTSFPLEKTVDMLLAGQRADSFFTIVHDRRLAVFDGRLMKIGDWFLLFGGHRAVPIFEENCDRPVDMNRVSYEGELRSWRLECPRPDRCEMAYFMICEQGPTIFRCMPKRFHLDEKPEQWPEIELNEP